MSYSIDEFSRNLGYIFNNPVVLITILVFLSIATYTDIKSLKIYNKCNIAFFISRIILIFIPIYSFNLNGYHIAGAIGGFLILIIPAIHFMQKMGGDLKLVFVLGFFLGIDLIFLLLAISFLLVMIYSFTRKLITKEEVYRVYVPFAPFFMTSFLIMLCINIICF